MISPWSESLTESEQEAELVSYWRTITDWAESLGVNSVWVEDTDPLIDLETLGAWQFHGTHQWRGDPSAARALLVRLRDLPAVNLVALLDGYEVIRVRDLSWDSVFVAEQPQAAFALPTFGTASQPAP